MKSEPKSETVCPAQNLRKSGWCQSPANRKRLSIDTLSAWSVTVFSSILPSEWSNGKEVLFAQAAKLFKIVLRLI